MVIIYGARLERVVLGGRCQETKHGNGGTSGQDGGEAEEVILLVYETSSRILPITTGVSVPST